MELKVHSIIGLDGRCNSVDNVYYLKSEADKVIEDLEESHKKEVGQLLIEIAKLNKKIKLYEDLGSCKKGCPALRHSQRRVESEIYKVKSNEKEIRHHKYKRCLAMAMWCEERYHYLTCLENWQLTGKEYQQVIGDYWDRWYNRWLEIATQFKGGV
ncbi:MAG: hypothetical protein K5651_07135 [Bacteroidales bacterium]|nr:hypothetical protein [Bacteroidales bacterium]